MGVIKMGIDNQKTCEFIQELRKRKDLTQNQLGEKLNVSNQAVSKWERGETLPDTSLLLDLAKVLETSVDTILNGGEMLMDIDRKISIKDNKVGIDNLSELGNLIGRDNTVYQGLGMGINQKMNINVEECFSDFYKREALISESVVQNINSGA